MAKIKGLVRSVNELQVAGQRAVDVLGLVEGGFISLTVGDLDAAADRAEQDKNPDDERFIDWSQYQGGGMNTTFPDFVYGSMTASISTPDPEDLAWEVSSSHVSHILRLKDGLVSVDSSIPEIKDRLGPMVVSKNYRSLMSAYHMNSGRIFVTHGILSGNVQLEEQNLESLPTQVQNRRLSLMIGAIDRTTALF